MRAARVHWAVALLLVLSGYGACTHPTEEGAEDVDCLADDPPVVQVAITDGVTGVAAAEGARGWMKEGSTVVDSLQGWQMDAEGRLLTLAGGVPQDPRYLDFWPGTYAVSIQKSGYLDWQSGTFDVPTPGPCPAGQRFEARLVPEP